MRSMTGFGVGEAPLAAEGKSSPTGKLMVEIRAVNHRFLDVRVRAPNQAAKPKRHSPCGSMPGDT